MISLYELNVHLIFLLLLLTSHFHFIKYIERMAWPDKCMHDPIIWIDLMRWYSFVWVSKSGYIKFIFIRSLEIFKRQKPVNLFSGRYVSLCFFFITYTDLSASIKWVKDKKRKKTETISSVSVQICWLRCVFFALTLHANLMRESR